MRIFPPYNPDETVTGTYYHNLLSYPSPFYRYFLAKDHRAHTKKLGCKLRQSDPRASDNLP